MLVEFMELSGIKLCEFRNKYPQVLSPLFDELRVGVLLQTLSDVISNLDETLPRVFELLTLRQTFLWSVQLLQGCLHWTHSLFTHTKCLLVQLL